MTRKKSKWPKIIETAIRNNTFSNDDAYYFLNAKTHPINDFIAILQEENKDISSAVFYHKLTNLQLHITDQKPAKFSESYHDLVYWAMYLA